TYSLRPAGPRMAALVNTLPRLIVARVIQGAGGGIFPLAFGIIRDEFPREKVAGAIGFLSALLGVGAGAGIVLGGLIVGMTSVGSGSLMIVLLLFVYPTIGANQLVGTDLTQAVPLTLAAAIGALIFGHVVLDVTGSLIIGSVPAVLVGSMLSSTIPRSWRSFLT
ncbi:hypothetical protein B4Q13_17860, partial [Lacticaseibacillus rhamnosus]